MTGDAATRARARRPGGPPDDPAGQAGDHDHHARRAPGGAAPDAPPEPDAPELTLEPAMAQRLLEELIYERVRTQVDILALGWFESDLDTSIRRVMASLDARAPAGEPPSEVMAATLVDRAWRRVTGEWQSRRGLPADDCPLCELDLAAGPVEPCGAREPAAPWGRPARGKRARGRR